jgi:hypothetical protein
MSDKTEEMSAEGKAAPPPPPKSAKPAAAGGDEPAADEAEVLEIESAVEYDGEEVGPDAYRHYTLTVEGGDSDLAVFDISLTVQDGSANVFVNRPDKGLGAFPTKDEFDWNVKRGQLVGRPGVYCVSVYGVPSFIDKDIGGFLEGDDKNWTTFNMYFEWHLMTPEQLAEHNAVEDKFASRKERCVCVCVCVLFPLLFSKR